MGENTAFEFLKITIDENESIKIKTDIYGKKIIVETSVKELYEKGIVDDRFLNFVVNKAQNIYIENEIK